MKFWILVIGIYLGFGAWNLALICNSVSAFGFRISNLIKDLLSQNETPYVQQPRLWVTISIQVRAGPFPLRPEIFNKSSHLFEFFAFLDDKGI